MQNAKMRNWGVIEDPFFGTIQLIGQVYGHPVLTDGHQITTSPIEGVEGDKIRTRNTLYELDGPANEEFAKFVRDGLNENDEPVDELQALLRAKITNNGLLN